MITGIIIGTISTIAVVILLYFLFFKKRIESDSRNAFEKLASKVFEEKISIFLDMGNKVLGAKKDEIKGELEAKEKIFIDLIKNLQDDMRKKEDESLKTFTELKSQLDEHGRITNDLKLSTSKLNQILSNSRLRGQYGEKVAEDILKASGLIEKIHYIKNKRQETITTRPDFTFLLPDKFKINMDVKFPLDNYSRFLDAENSNDQESSNSYKKQFLKDIKAKIGEVSSRDYINPQEDTLDYVMLFIPNESIAAFIQETFPEIFDLAVEKKVVFVSPYLLLSFISIIRQAFQNFHYEERTKNIIKLIGEFSKRFILFKKRFFEVGEKIDNIKSSYEDIEEKSFKQIDSTISKIEKHKEGLPLEEIEGLEAKSRLLE